METSISTTRGDASAEPSSSWSAGRATRVRAACVLALLSMIASPAAAQRNQYTIEGDAYGRAEPGTALLVMQGQGEVNPYVSAEAFVWGGLRDTDGDGDVLTVSVRVTDPARRVGLRVGRFVETLGAIRPVHMDGATAWARLPGQFRVEAFGGLPVVPDFGERDYDWVVGSRVSRGIGDWGSLGVAYLHRRDAGALSDQEVGVDAGVQLTDWLEAHGVAAYDLVNPGFSEARISVSASDAGEGLYGDVFATHRSPSRILPATSLFSVLGDTASEHVGASGRYRLFPRLDLEATAAARVIGDFWGPSLRLATVLRLDPFGESALTLEARRESAPEDGNWTGLRAALRVVIVDGLSGIGEVEVVVPDHPDQRGEVWPWALAGLSWRIAERWDLAGAVQGESSPRHTSRLDGLVRVTYRWDLEEDDG